MKDTTYIDALSEQELPVVELHESEIYPAPEGVFFSALTHEGRLHGWYCIRVQEGGRDVQVRVTVIDGKLISARKIVFPNGLPSERDLDAVAEEYPIVRVAPSVQS